MTTGLAKRFTDAVQGTPLEAPLARAVQPLLHERGGDASLQRLDGPLLTGVARAIAAQPETAIFLSHRPALLERIAGAGAGSLVKRSRELDSWSPDSDGADLEFALDSLRLRRREETCLAACIDHAGLVPFEEVSSFLSHLAETITQQALLLARDAVAGDSLLEFAVIGMGKIAGREFTYHSDLDLIFLYEGGPDAVTDASRVGQRLISYLMTMTGAGVAYAVDTRLRPSGGQGMLVASLDGFEHYQCEQAQTWEHVAMLRARPIAGDLAGAQEALGRVRSRVLEGHGSPWNDLMEMRQRVETERSTLSNRKLPLKTGSGGLMDVDFLAGGAILERVPPRLPDLPSVPAMLRAVVRGARVEDLLEDYSLLRRVEAVARWMAGRAVEFVDAEQLDATAELTQPGLGGDELRERLAAARERIRHSYRSVVASGTIGALESSASRRSQS